jgi:hydroxymethylpyrimidine/phosphomethylpyrimidine kinase
MGVPRALSISATDPGGGLLAADLLTFEVLGAAGAGVVSAVTAEGVRQPGAVQDVPVAVLRASLESTLSSPPDAVKVGILTTVPAVRTVARCLSALSAPRVFEPGFAPRTGVRLLRAPVVDALVRELLPTASLVTVNLAEASALAGLSLQSEADVKAAARRVQALGPSAVLVTGGDGEGPCVVDGLLDGRTWHRFESPRADVAPGCGAGGLLSAAITAYLAAGETLPDAVARGLGLVRRALAAGWPAVPGVLRASA